MDQAKIDAFLAELTELSRRHRIVIALDYWDVDDYVLSLAPDRSNGRGEYRHRELLLEAFPVPGGEVYWHEPPRPASEELLQQNFAEYHARRKQALDRKRVARLLALPPGDDGNEILDKLIAVERDQGTAALVREVSKLTKRPN